MTSGHYIKDQVSLHVIKLMIHCHDFSDSWRHLIYISGYVLLITDSTTNVILRRKKKKVILAQNSPSWSIPFSISPVVSPILYSPLR